MAPNRAFVRILVFTLCIIPIAALAGDKADPVGKANHGPAVIEWTPTVDHEKLTLTVVGPNGTVSQKNFGRGQNPSFRLNDLNGVEGLYTYEIRVTPNVSEGAKKKLAAARAANDDALAAQLQRELGLDQAVVQSGNFTLLQGRFLDGTHSEPTAHDTVTGAGVPTSVSTNATRRPGAIATMDQVIPDDLIVQSSTCTGFDCVDGESFGFDTLRLKENNLRLHFEDTSSSAGYPANDWRLVANDSASGGANKFVIEDSTAARNPFTIVAAAPANSIYVNSSGDVGFQTAAPLLDLHVTTGNTPGLRFEQTNSGGFTAQTWDVAGNEANFFVRDLTSGSRLPFRIRPGATTSSIDINASGNVGINNGSPGNYKLDAIIGSTDGVRFFADATTAKSGIEFLPSNTIENRILSFDRQTTSYKKLLIQANAGGGIYLDTNGNIGIGQASPAYQIHHSSGARLDAGSWVNASSRALKQNINELGADDAFSALENLNPVTFAYTSNPSDQQVGFIAEEVPELVATNDHKGIASMDVVAVLTKVVKEQQKTIEQLQQRLENVEKSNNQ